MTSEPGSSGIAGGSAFRPVRDGDVLDSLRVAGLDQAWFGDAALNLAVAALDDRTTVRYGDCGRRYACSTGEGGCPAGQSDAPYAIDSRTRHARPVLGCAGLNRKTILFYTLL